MTPEDPGERFGDWREARRRKWEARRERRMARFHSGGVVSFGQAAGGRLVMGAIILLVGILFLLENLGFVRVTDLWSFWPVILIALGIARLIEGRGLGSWIWGATVAGAGIVFLANNLGFFPWNIWRLIWPALLILAGVLILVYRGFETRVRWAGEWLHPYTATGSENVLSEYAIFGGVKRRIESGDFEGGEALAIFGGVEIDMHRAFTTREDIQVEVNAIFGGVDLWVPDNWDVSVQGAGILGGFEDKTHHAAVVEGIKRPRLVIRGSAVFGGVTVKN
ncbi:MAG TPA: DUF5668 domain-containing protein [Bryobacteraceae bacterium]|jgi:predicted membrane protein